MRPFLTTAAMTVAALIAALPAAAQDAAEEVWRVEDVVVEGRRLDQAAEAYVSAVARPARGRGTARWDDGVCVGAVNFRAEVGQQLVDRVSDVARELGIRALEPGCAPNILIFGTDDGAALASSLVDARPLNFRPRASGTSAGGAALRAFRQDDRAVRWWHVSTPIDSMTGRRATRVSGDVFMQGDTTDSPTSYAPQISVVGGASRLNTQIEDRIDRAYVIIDVDGLGDVGLGQLADYVALVSLAQIDPNADLARFDSILNLFEPGGAAVTGLSPWDLAYLEGLYAVRFGYVSQGAQRDALGRSLLRAYESRVPDAQ